MKIIYVEERRFPGKSQYDFVYSALKEVGPGRLCSRIITFVARRNLAAISRIMYGRPAALYTREREPRVVLSSLHARDAEFMHADYCSIRSGRVSPTDKSCPRKQEQMIEFRQYFSYLFDITSR